MAVAQRVLPGFYRDSVSLMQCASQVQNLPGVEQAGAMMATDANLDLAREAGMLAPGETVEAGPNDLLLLVKSTDESLAESAFKEAQRILTETKAETGETTAEKEPRSLRRAVARTSEASLALISTPGEYAASEARKALDSGLDVMVFSDNVELADEIELKRLAHERGLLVMGPDCGTAIVAGIPLGFANVVRRGDIGVAGASGTGTQQVTCLADRWGAGISHALGTGSHDLSDDVGGLTMLDAIDALARDDATSVLLLVSKPPSPTVAGRVLDAAARGGKPVVACFLGADAASLAHEGARFASTLDEAAAIAVEVSTGSRPTMMTAEEIDRLANEARAKLQPQQRYVRGLYSGGTFGYEASLILSAQLEGQPIWSNTPAKPADAMDDPWESREHTVVDLGDDVFTRGRPHPMIDYRLRKERIEREVEDEAVAVVLLDIVLGYGSHPDPASELVPSIETAREKARSKGREVAIVGSVCGTAGDPQGLSATEGALRDAGVLLADSNAAAARLAASIVRGRRAW